MVSVPIIAKMMPNKNIDYTGSKLNDYLYIIAYARCENIK